MDGAQVGVLEEIHEVGLGGLLQRQHSLALELQIRLTIQRNLPHQPLEGQLSDEEVRGLLVLPDLSERRRAGAMTVRLLAATRHRRLRRLAASRLARCRLRGGFAGSLLRGHGSRHTE